MIKRYALTLLVGLGIVLGFAIPAQAVTVPEAPAFAVVGVEHATDAATHRDVTINVLAPANREALQMRALSSCLAGHSCAWTDASYGGSMLDIVFSLTCCGCLNLNGGFANTISSSSTQFGSGYGITWYVSTGCTGNSAAQHHNTNIPNWTNQPPLISSWNDNFESFQIGVG